MVRSFLVYELILLLYSINNIVFQPLYQILDTLINFYIISNKSSIEFIRYSSSSSSSHKQIQH